MSDKARVFSLNKPSRLTLKAGATLIVDGVHCILVDSGNFESPQQLEQSLQDAAGIGVQDITDVFYTHLHYDHFSPRLIAQCQADIHIPETEFHFINALMQHRHSKHHFCSFLQDTHDLIAPVFLRQFFSFADDDRYQLSQLQLNHHVHLCHADELLTPHVKTVDLSGHCPGQLGLEIATDHGSALLTGDAIICLQDYMAADTQHHLIVHHREKLMASRERVAHADFVIPGHGDWFDPRQQTLFRFQEKPQ